MRTTAYWLTLCALALAVVVLWSYNAHMAQASECNRETPCRIA